jgi:asparagine synthase (glutamine-hydrolysing)
MSGIAGWMAPAHSAPDDGAVLPMLESLAHRGPDGAGACALPNREQRVVLGHRRLAVGDAPAAPQPACDEAAGLALTLDGEIDNLGELRAELAAHGYSFGAGSDGEIVLKAYQHWDKELACRLRGAFALALWDARKGELMLARDRFGERPLYLCESAGSVFFASEVKALLKIPGIRAEADPHAVRDYLAYGYVPGPRTLFKGIRKLMPATYTLWQRGRRREVRYWTPPDRDPRAPEKAAAGDPVRGFLAELESAVKLRMAAGATGAFLSGGLDSSAIVALMSRHCTNLKTFSVGFGGERARELPHAAQVAKHFGTEHHEVVISREDLLARLAKLVAYRDAPVSAPSEVALYLLACEAARSVKRVLTGEGSDELLGGHRRHVVERLGWPLARGDWRSRFVRAAGALRRDVCDALSGPKLNGAPVLDARLPFDAAPGNSSLRRVLYFDQTSTLPDNLLERHDRMTMAASIAARGPFLDHRLAEYVSALPDGLRVRGMRTKWILRAAARQLMPMRMRRGPGPGARMPRDWLRGNASELLLEHLRSRSSLTRAYYNAPVLDRVLDEHLKGRHNHQELLWMLLNLEIWHRTYRHA